MTSKVCILDSYCPTVSILKHKKDLTVIQIWHSIGSMKKFGYTSLNLDEGSKQDDANLLKMHKNYNIICASSKKYANDLAKGFGYDKSYVKIFTLPRIDLLFDKKYEQKIKKEIYLKYPQLNNNKKTILYVPTFRKNESEFNKALNDLLENIDYSKYNFILRLHPLSKVELNTEYPIIIDKSFESFDMIFVADLCISDYSCIIYEAGLRNIPLYFYNYDYNKYLKSRGLAINYDELPGFKCKTGKEIVKSFSKRYDMDYLEWFINEYVENEKDCTQKLVKEIKKYMK